MYNMAGKRSCKDGLCFMWKNYIINRNGEPCVRIDARNLGGCLSSETELPGSLTCPRRNRLRNTRHHPAPQIINRNMQAKREPLHQPGSNGRFARARHATNQEYRRFLFYSYRLTFTQEKANCNITTI